MSDYAKKWELASQYDREFETRKWSHEIPALHFDTEWDVKILPPFSGAIIRFSINHNNKYISVYLDCYSLLGAVYEPYWEVYDGEDTERFMINDTDKLMKHIQSKLK